MWDGLAAYLRGIDASIGVRPKAVLVISGHWENPLPTLNIAAKPGLLFDYYGFPDHTYRLKYPAAGAPELAERVRKLLDGAGFQSDVESKRGLDHGVFVPFLLIYPNADVPILQLSLQASLDPGLHLELGKALAPLRARGAEIIVADGGSTDGTAVLARPLADLVVAIQEYYGAPRDIEWAFAGDRFYIVQSRPLTRKAP